MAVGLTREELGEAVRRKILRPLFATLVGDHLTGLSSQDAAYHLVGAMAVPAREVLGLRPVSEVKERQVEVAGWRVDLRFHEVRPCLDLIARRNNTRILEELFAPQVIFTGEEHARLKSIARGFVTKASQHDFVDRALKHRECLKAETGMPLRHLLEAARLYMCGIHLMTSGEFQSSVATLATEQGEDWLSPYLERQAQLAARAEVSPDEMVQAELELERLTRLLQKASVNSNLPDSSGSISALDEFLVDMRLAELQGKTTSK